jgi:glycine reductase
VFRCSGWCSLRRHITRTAPWGINRAALLNTIAEPRVIADIEVHLAHPGESCRIVHVLDAVPLMVKVEGRSTVFPGFFGPAMPAGDGRNHLLRGATVLVCGTFPIHQRRAVPAEVLIDMSGPAAPLRLLRTPQMSSCVSSCPEDHNAEFDAALHRAKLKAAVYLARATASIEP